MSAVPRSDDTEALRLAHYAYLSGLMPEQIARLSWTRPRIAQEQTSALRRLLAHAKAHSRFHRDRLAGIDVAAMTPAEMGRIPPMTKADLMAHWDDIVTLPGVSLAQVEAFVAGSESFRYFPGRNVVVTSGGTSGQTGMFLYDWNGWAINRGAMMRAVAPRAFRYGGMDAVSSATVSANAPTHFSCMMTQCFAPPRNRLVRLPIALPLAEIVAGLNAARPTVLHCFSSYARVLAHETLAGRLRIKPKLTFCTSEPLSDSDADFVRQVWGGDVFSSWAASESVGTTPCIAGRGFHVLEDLNLIEPMAADGAAFAGEGACDHVLVTNFYNPALPLIRYRMDDRFEFSPRPCGCGSQYKHVRRVHGRAYQLFRYADTVIHPEVLEAPVIQLAQVSDYQLVQTPRGVDVFVVASRRMETGGIAREVGALAARLGLADPQIHVAQVDSLARTANGKSLRYVALGA